MRHRTAAVLALTLTLGLAAPAPAHAEGIMGFFQMLGTQVVKIARSVQSAFGGGESPPVRPSELEAATADTPERRAGREAGEEVGREVARELEGVAEAMRSTASELDSRGINVKNLEAELKGLEPELKELARLEKQAKREMETEGVVSPSTERELLALRRRLEPKMRALGDKVANQAKEAIETFQEKFTEEDIARLKSGMQKVGGFLEGFAGQLKAFFESQGIATEGEK